VGLEVIIELGRLDTSNKNSEAEMRKKSRLRERKRTSDKKSYHRWGKGSGNVKLVAKLKVSKITK